MSISLQDKSELKDLLRDAVIEALESRQDLIRDALSSVLEDIALAKAMESAGTELVPEEEVMRVLDDIIAN